MRMKKLITNKKSGKIIVLICLLSTWVHLAGAQVIKKLGLTESVKLSIQANKTLRISKAQVEAAAARLSQAKDRQLPQLGVSGSYYRLSQPTITPGNGLKALLSGNKTGSTTTTTTTNPTNTNPTNTNSAPASFPTINQAILVQANLTIPIFAGFKTKYSIESDQFLLKAAALNATHVTAEVAINTVSAYYNIYKLQANKKLLQQDLDEQNRRVKDFSNLEVNGLLTRNDLLKAEVQQSNIKLSLLDISNSLEIGLYNFKVMLGLGDSIVVDIDTLQLFPDHTIRAKADYLQAGLNQRRDLQAYGQQNESYKASVKGAKSGYYPSIALSGGYIDAWIPNFIIATNVITASIGVRYNLTDIFTTKHDVQQAKASLKQSEASFDQMSDNIKMSVNQNFLNYNQALQKIEVTSSTIAQAAENFRITKNKYTNSLSTLTDLLDADVALLQTQINKAEAKADAEIAYYRLLESSGEEIKF